MTNSGREYEKFVADLQQAILDSESFVKHKNIKIELNKKIPDKNGRLREFDLYWEYELGGISYKTVIECKEYKRRVSIDRIDALIGKLVNFQDIRGVFTTNKGYQKGAEETAIKNNIELLVVREQNDSDWEDENGNPYIREINIDMTILSPARIINFSPTVDGKWVKEHTNIDVNTSLHFTERNDQIFIEDLSKGERYSLFDLEHKLIAEGNKTERNSYIKTENFEHAFIIYNNNRLKLKSYVVEYHLPDPIELPINIDLSKEMKGVIEYLSKGIKRIVYKNGRVQKETFKTNR